MRWLGLHVGALLVGALLGCGESGAAADAAAEADRATELGLGQAGERASAAAGEPSSEPVDDGEPVAMPRPGQRRGDWAVALNESCESCHLTEARQWRASRHHRADSNSAYRAAFEREGRSPFCTSCHAPEAKRGEQPTAAARALGVGCVSCHVVGDGDDYSVLAASAPRAGDGAPHRLSRSDDFAMAGACASCHEFRFDGRVGNDAETFMQTTVREMHRVAGEQASCAACHMQPIAGRTSHAFDSVRDPAWLRAQLQVSAALLEGGDLQLRLTQRKPGHAYPTGDLFRRLEIGATWLDADGAALERRTDYLARHFVLLPDSPRGRTLALDNRVLAGPSTVVLERTDTATEARALRWWVTLQRVATVGDGRDPEAAEIESEVRLHDGWLSLPAVP